ncbi:MAG: DUF4347 domain-containing protein, partial [Alphaproteobacteria bacterium]|nr:DUF4347 domain-containing protein [Alphaproteobacteria bacterium]
MNATFDPAARHPARVGILALESRIMFDGAAVAEMVDTIADGKEADSPASTHVPTRNGADPSPSAAAPVVERDGPAAERPAIVAPAERHEVVVVDTSVEDWQSLVAGMNPNTPMILLEPDKDGMSELEQMAAALSQFDDLDAIHLVAEGRTGAVILGREALTSDDLAAVGPQLAQIGATLKPGGDFMLYSCSVAGGPVGAAFIDDLSRAMGGVDIAASTDLTGPTILGGDWDLEYRVGEVETVLPFTLQGMQDISHCLGCTVSGTKIYYSNTYVAHYGVFLGVMGKIYTVNDYAVGENNAKTDGIDMDNLWSTRNNASNAVYIDALIPVLCPSGPANTAPTFTGGANAGLTLSENAAITTITTAMLEVKDAEQATSARTYTVSTAPTKGTLTKSGATVSASGTFTQADIDAGNIKYTPTANNIGADSFAFSVADGAGGSLAGQTFSITINDVNPAISNASVSWDENNSTGTVATVTATGDTNGLTYAITGGNTGTAFAIDNNGAITVNSVAALDYETTPTFSLTVTVDDEDADATADSTATITVNLNNLNDAPVNTVPGAQTTNEDTNLVFSSGNGNALSVAETDAGQTLTTVVSVGAGTGTLTVTTGGGATINTNGTNSVEIIGTAAQVNSALGTVTYAPTGDANGTGYATLQIQTTDNGTGTLSDTDTVSINVTAIADTPAVTNASTTPATQTTDGLVLTRNANDGTEVTHFKITGITNGNLFQSDGSTAISNGDFITFAQGNAGLKFTPTGGGDGAFTAQAATSAGDGGLGGGTVSATIAVGMAVSSPTVAEDAASGTVTITQGAAETHYKITAITGGTLYSDAGLTTQVTDGTFIGAAGATTPLYFVPTGNRNGTTGGNASFVAQAASAANDVSLIGSQVTSTITLSPVADTPQLADITVVEDTDSGAITITRSANDGAETTHFKITGITGGTLWSDANFTTQISNGDFLASAGATTSVYFRPTAQRNTTTGGNGSFTIQASSSGADGGLGGSTVTNTITLTPAADTPAVASPTVTEDTDSGAITITRSANDGA